MSYFVRPLRSLSEPPLKRGESVWGSVRRRWGVALRDPAFLVLLAVAGWLWISVLT